MEFLSKNHSKPLFEFEDDFPMDTKGVFQDLHHLDDLSLTGSSFDPDYATHVAGYDPFGPLPYGLCSTDLDLCEFKPLELVKDGGITVNPNNLDKGLMGWSEPDFSTPLGLVDYPVQDPKPVSFFVPDEGSCVTADNGIKKGNRKAWKGKRKANSSKGQWSKEEDRVLKEMVEKYGVRKWSYIAQMLRGRIGKQCRERWHNHLRPDIKKDFWTEEEDRILIAAHAEVGNKWSEIAKKLPGRTENSTKNHWNATKRRQYTKRKCRSKWPRPSPILQNYIKSLNLPRGRSQPVNLKRNLNRSNLDRSSAVVKPPPSSSVNEDEFDYSEVPEFALDEKLFEEDNNVDSLFDEMPSIGEEISSYLMASSSCSSGGLQGEVKRELDLMEMISQVNL